MAGFDVTRAPRGDDRQFGRQFGHRHRRVAHRQPLLASLALRQVATFTASDIPQSGSRHGICRRHQEIQKKSARQSRAG